MRTRPPPTRGPGTRSGARALLAAALLSGAPAAAQDCADPPPYAAGRKKIERFSARVADVDARLELILADGRRVKVAGLDPPRPTPDAPDLDETTARRLKDWLAGRDALFVPLYKAPDRWGRIVAEAYAPAGAATGPASVAGAALEAGLARFEAGEASRRCRAYLLGREGAARAAGLGVWADPYYAVLAPGDRAAFAERAGTTAIVEGEVVDVETSDYRVALLFGERRGRDFSVSIERRDLKRFAAAGLDPATLKGGKVRVRGVLDLRFGPRIEIERPEEIELIAPADMPAAGAAAPEPR